MYLSLDVLEASSCLIDDCDSTRDIMILTLPSVSVELDSIESLRPDLCDFTGEYDFWEEEEGLAGLSLFDCGLTDVDVRDVKIRLGHQDDDD